MAVKTKQEPYVVLSCFRIENKEVDDAVVFFGTKEQCEEKFNELLIDGDDLEFYIAKVTKQAIPNWDITAYTEE